MSTHSNWTWDEMVDAFRALGGTVENIRSAPAERGRGLFAIDITKPMMLRVPENLLFPVDDVELVDDQLRLKSAAFVEEAERNFFNRYQEFFAWGANGRAEWTTRIAAFDALPANIRDLLSAEFGMAKWAEGDAVARVARLFVESRQIGWNDRAIIAPLLDLANYAAEGLSCEIGAGVHLGGTVRDEILIAHSAQDAWSLLLDFGQVGSAPGAFSLALKLNVGSSELAIGRDTGRSVQRGNYLVPELVREGSEISLSHLLLGHAPYPAVPRGIFRALTNSIFGENTDEVFDSIRQFNYRKFVSLLTALEPHTGSMISSVEKAARFHLEALSWSIGSLDLHAPVPGARQKPDAQLARSKPAQTGWGWERMLEAFRALGGEAENIRLAYGPSGRGLFSINRDKPFRLRVPQNLLFPVSDIVFEDGRIGIRADAPVGTAEREFFAHYEEGFSWGDAGQAESAAFITAFEELPVEVREFLSAQFGMTDLFEGDRGAWAQLHFLQRRAIEWKGRAVVAPIVELANHRLDGNLYTGAEHVEIAGESGDEAFVSYRAADAFECFRRFAIASPEPVAFAMPMKAKLAGFHLVVERDIPRQVARGNFIKPQIWRDGDRVIVSFVPVGHQDFPKLSRGTFRALIRGAGVVEDEADEAFDRILHFNRTKFLRLLEVLAPHRGKLIGTLRKMAEFQLEAMMWCIGSREG